MRSIKLILIVLMAIIACAQTAWADNYHLTFQQNGYYKINTASCSDGQLCDFSVNIIGSDDGKPISVTVKADFSPSGGNLRFSLLGQPVPTSQGAVLQIAPRQTYNGHIDVALVRPASTDMPNLNPAAPRDFDQVIPGKVFARLTINIDHAAPN